MLTVVFIITFYQKNHLGFYKFLLTHILKGFQVHLLMPGQCELDLEPDNNLSVYYPELNESNSAFLRRNYALIKRADALIFEELYSFKPIYVWLLMRFGKKSQLIVHNANKWLFRGSVKSVMDFGKNSMFQTIKKQIEGIVVVSQSVKEYIQENHLFSGAITYLPFSYYPSTTINDENTEEKQGGSIFTIPGTINSERRNYKLFINAFSKLIQDMGLTDLKLVLLGRLVKLGTEELNLIKQVNLDKPESILYWEDFIDDDTFDHWLSQTDYLIGNVNVDYAENTVREIYGKSKETGILFSMMQYKKPTLFPMDYNISQIYGELVLRYPEEMDKLILCLKALINGSFTIKSNQSDKHDVLVREQIRSFREMLESHRQ